MSVEVLKHGWVALWMAAALSTAGCATSAEVLREDSAAGAYSAQALPASASWEKRPRVRLRRRHGAPVAGTEPLTQGPPSCGGQAVPEGWPDYSSWLDEDLLAPFFQCASPGEFLALQRRVDMPRLLETVDDWSAVRLGALGPMEAPAAAVLQRKRFSFLVNAPRLYGAYAQVLTLFLIDTAFDDEVRELLQLLARDKQLQQTVGQMEAVLEALARRGFQLSDYPDRKEQLRDVVRGLGRAVDDVAATIPGADGARGTRVYGVRAHLPPPYQEAFDETERALTTEQLAPGHVALGTFDHLTFGVPVGFYYLAAGTGHGVYTLTQGQYEQATRELAPAALMVGLYVGGKGLRSFSGAKGVAGLGAEGMRLPVPELRLQMLRAVVERLQARLSESDFAQLVRWLQGSREVAVLVATHGEPFAMALIDTRGDPVRAQAVFSQAKPEPTGSTSAKPGTAQPPHGAASIREAPLPDTPIRNAHLAGKRHPVTGVPFDADGYPDFRAAGAVKAEVKITYTGSRVRDFAAANAAAGLRETPKGMTWHHHQDRTTMQLVPTEIHAKTGHTGGFSGDP